MSKIDINQLNTKPTEGNAFKIIRVKSTGGELEYVKVGKESFNEDVISLLGRIPKWKTGTTYETGDVVLHNGAGSWQIFIVKDLVLTTTEEPSDEAADWESVTSAGGGGSIDYTRATGVKQAVGGVAVGYVPSGTIQDMLDAIFYPFTLPFFTSSSVSGTNVKTVYDLGEKLLANTVINFNYAISEIAKMKDAVNSGIMSTSDSAKFVTPVPFNIKAAASPTTVTVGATDITFNVKTKIDFTLTGTYVTDKGVDGPMSTTKSIEWNPRRYRGYVPADSLAALQAVTSHAALLAVPGIVISAWDNTYARWSGTHTYNLSAYASNPTPGGHVFYLYDNALGNASFMSGTFSYATNKIDIASYTTVIDTAVRPYVLYHAANASSGATISVTPS